MQLIGRNFSPFTRRVAISLRLLGIEFEQVGLSTFEHREQILRFNPLGRIPILLPDSSATPLIDSWAILDYLDQLVPEPQRLLPASGELRQQRLNSTALAVGVIEKCVARFYEVSRRAPEQQSPEILALLDQQICGGLQALERELTDVERSDWSINGHPSQADVSCYVALQCASLVSGDAVTARDLPRLRNHEQKCGELKAFRESPLT